jgi:ABC-2 type transport system permease protein
MRNIWVIAKREYDHYFTSPLAYVVAFTILLVLGIIFAVNIFYYSQNAFQNFGSAPDVTSITGAFVFLLVLTVPALTMRLVSDEQRMGTMELLLTAPVRDAELIIGKWLGGFLFILSIIVVTLIFPLILNNLVDPGIDQRLMLTAYLGIILISASFLGLGVGISAMFSNQVASFFVTMVTFVFLWWLVGFPADVLPVGGNIFNYLSMQSHFYDSLNRGVIQLGDLVYFTSLTALGLFVGTTMVEMRRWR